MKTWAWEERIHPEDAPKFQEKWNHCLKTGETWHMEFRIRNKEAGYSWQLAQGLPLLNECGQIGMWITTTTDIQKLKEEEETKADFLKLVSHELKTPVTSIKGYVQLLLNLIRNRGDELPNALPLQPSMERIDRQINRLTHLISEILDLSRVESDQLVLHKEELNINRLVDDTVQDMMFLNPTIDIRVTHTYRCRIFADKHRMEQVLINFITNAIKYSPANREVHIEVFESLESKAAICIRDKGIGIAEKDREKIFQRFFRSDKPESDTYPGFGIGLYLSKEIVNRHQGEIRVESSLGKGSEFTVLLPCHGNDE